MKTIRRVIRPEQIRELTLLLIVIVVILIFGSQIDNYYSFRFFNRVATSVAIITVVGIGETLVILTRNVDLSVGSIMGFTAYFVGQQLSNNNDIAPIFAVLMAVGVGMLLGLFNGIVVAYGRVPAIVSTLGTLAIYRGFLVQYSNAESIITARLPDWLKDLPRAAVLTSGEFELRTLVVIAIAVVVIAQLVLVYFSFGRKLYAIGSSPEAADIAGIPSRRLVTTAFVLCGGLAGLAGFMFLARFGTITVVAGQGFELQVVAAVVVGGVNIFGGTGSAFGAMLGAVLIGTLEQSLIRTEISEFWKDALLGVFILIAVAVDALLLDRLRTLWARTELEHIPVTTTEEGVAT